MDRLIFKAVLPDVKHLELWLSLRQMVNIDRSEAEQQEVMRQQLQDQQLFSYFLLDDERHTAGLVEISLGKDASTACLDLLVLKPSFQQTEIAHWVFEDIELWAKARGFRWLTSNLLGSNLFDQHFYQDQGFNGDALNGIYKKAI